MILGHVTTHRSPHEHGSDDTSKYDKRYDFSVHRAISPERWHVIATRHHVIRILIITVIASRLCLLRCNHICGGGPFCNKTIAHGKKSRTKKYANEAECQRAAEDTKQDKQKRHIAPLAD